MKLQRFIINNLLSFIIKLYFFMRYKKQTIVIASLTVIVAFIQCSKTFEKADINPVSAEEHAISSKKSKSLVAQGKEIFRFDDFGDKDFWSGLLHIERL